MGDGTLHAVRGVTLSVERGEYVVFMGPSGSGKSTLMHVAGCLDRPSAGACWLDGERVEELPDAELSRLRNRKIGFVFQSFYLIPQLDVVENVEVPLYYAGVEPRERRQLAAESLEAVGLGHRLGHRPNQLSGGERQRVAIARALVGRPEIVLADEPTGNLDSRTGDEVMEILEKQNARGVTLVVVTHDPEKARRARRVVQMRDGRVAWEQRSDDEGFPNGPTGAAVQWRPGASTTCGWGYATCSPTSCARF
jgi:putative ABC transport system ATP-binding protein